MCIMKKIIIYGGCILSYHPTISCSTFVFVNDIFWQQVHAWAGGCHQSQSRISLSLFNPRNTGHNISNSVILSKDYISLLNDHCTEVLSCTKCTHSLIETFSISKYYCRVKRKYLSLTNSTTLLKCCNIVKSRKNSEACHHYMYWPVNYLYIHT